ncbi:MAG TPA: TetR/AcrR family transcriptional regulator [Sporichthyaceae bacterium]|jgi:AcrR family transcriptional regulator
MSEPAVARPRYDAESLLAVAAQVFTERGYDATGMEHLAKAAGITKSSFYHHVSGKEELLRRSLDRALDGLFGVLEAADTGPAVARLEQLLRAAVQVLAEEQPHVTLLLRVRGNTDVERAALARRREFDRRVADLVRQAAADGDLRSDIDPDLAARLLFGTVNSLIEWYIPGGRLTPDNIGDAVVALTLDGLRTSL